MATTNREWIHTVPGDACQNVRVSTPARAYLIQGHTVNNNTYFAWEINGSEYFISTTVDDAREKMDRAIADRTVF